jgi:hypothetical protein
LSSINVFYRCRDFAGAVDAWGGDVPRHPLKDIYVVNNTFWQTKGPFMLHNKDVEHVVVRNNIFGATTGVAEPLWFPQAKESAAQYTVENNLQIKAGKWFVDPEAGDFRLLPGSPAIDKGSATDAPGEDFAGNGRPFGGGIDVGAFEFGATSKKPVPVAAGKSEAAAPKQPKDSAPRYLPVAGAVEDHKSRLLKRLRDVLAGGKKPTFNLQSLASVITVHEIDAEANLRVTLKQGGQTSAKWSQLSPEDLLNLALALAKLDDEPESHALAAFYLLAANRVDRAEEHLARAGALSAAVRGAFRLEESSTPTGSGGAGQPPATK